MGWNVAISLDPSPGLADRRQTPESRAAFPSRAGRSGQIAWRRLRRDRVAMAGGIFIVFLILVAVIGPHLVQNPDTYNSNLIDPTFSRPIGPWGGISLAHPLGVEPVNGRDMLARIVDGHPVLAADRLPRHRARGGHRGVLRHHRGLLRRLDRRGDRPRHGRLPGLPAAGIRDRPHRRHPELRVGTVRQHAAGLPAGLRHRLLRLALYGQDHPRPGHLAARAGIRRRGPQHRRAAARTSSSANCCPTWSRRSWSTRRC